VTKLPLPPGPRGLPFFGNLFDISLDLLGFLSKCADEYGEVFRLRIEKDRDTIVITRPEYIEHVLSRTNGLFIKGYQHDRVLHQLLGNGLVTGEGEYWRRQRRMTQPAFHRERVIRYGETMIAFAERMLSNWKDGEERDIHSEMMNVTMNIAVNRLRTG